MIPNLKEWKTWGALERVSYLAQLATAGAFLASTIFSFLTWYEASRARQEQREFFNAEKSPSLELKYEEVWKTANASGFMVVLRLRNVGIASARIKEITSHRYKIGIDSRIDTTKHDESCRDYVVQRGRSTKCYIYFYNVPSLPASVDKDSIILYSDEDRPPLDPKKVFGSLWISYEGLFNDQYNLQYEVVFNRGDTSEDLQIPSQK